MKLLSVLALVAAVGAGPGATVTVAPSSISFKDALAACPGALAGITFVLNHARIAEAAGVGTEIDDANPPVQTILLTDPSGTSASVTVNGSTHEVSAKNVKLAGANVACVSPD